MRKYDIVACAAIIILGLGWFAAAEVVYDGSLMEDPFLRSGMLAQLYVPLATMYLVKAARGEGRGTAIVAWLLSFLVLWGMTAVDVWVTHFKPNCDICCIPAEKCFMVESMAAIIVTLLAGISDVVILRLLVKIRHPLARQWFVRRALRLVGTVLLALLSCVVTYWVVFVVLRIAWLLWAIITQ